MSQGALFIPESKWRWDQERPAAPALFGRLRDVKVLAIDTETDDPGIGAGRGSGWARREGQVVGFSLAGVGWRRYVPLRHPEDNADAAPEKVLAWLGDELRHFTGELVGANLLYDLGWLSTEGVRVSDTATLTDIQHVDALLDENQRSYSLDSILRRYGLPPKDERLLREAAAAYGVDPKSGIAKLPARFVGDYAEWDAAGTLEAAEKQKPLVLAQELGQVLALERAQLPMLLEQRLRGIRVDMTRAVELRDVLQKRCDAYADELKRLSNLKIPSPWEPAAVARALEGAGVQGVPRTAKTRQPSITQAYLAKLAAESVAPAKVVLAWRKVDKAKSTFVESQILGHATRGRVHAEAHPLRSDDGGTVSGRYSYSDPGMQTIPARDPELSPLLRGLFLPEEGALWCAADYSQQEPRLGVHFAAIMELPGAAEAVKRYVEHPDTDYHQYVADMMGLSDRKPAKTINLGLAYGMQGPKLCKSLGLPVETRRSEGGFEYEVAGEEGQALFDLYHRSVPFVGKIATAAERRAGQRGYVTTLLGRRCRFDRWEPARGRRQPAFPLEEAKRAYPNQPLRRANCRIAYNRVIQGSAADMMKKALVDLFKAGIVTHLSLHDETGNSVGDPKQARLVAEIMRDTVHLRVPLKVDVDLGATWGAARPMSIADAPPVEQPA